MKRFTVAVPESKIVENESTLKLDLKVTKKSDTEDPKPIVVVKVATKLRVEAEKTPDSKLQNVQVKKLPSKKLSKPDPVPSPQSETTDQMEAGEVVPEEKPELKPRQNSVQKSKPKSRKRKRFTPKRKASVTSDRATPEPKRYVVNQVSKSLYKQALLSD
jgi:hypothetical protein